MPLTPEEKRARANASKRRWHLKHPEKAHEYWERWFEKNKDIVRKRWRENKIRAHEVTAGRPRPDRCEVCGGNERGPIEFAHCHQRGVFRGRICTGCNTILGIIQDDPDRLRKLIAYLERTKDIVPPQLSLPGI